MELSLQNRLLLFITKPDNTLIYFYLYLFGARFSRNSGQ